MCLHLFHSFQRSRHRRKGETRGRHLMGLLLAHFGSTFVALTPAGAGQTPATSFQNAPAQMFEGLFGPENARRPARLTVPSFRFTPIYSVQEAGIPAIVRSTGASYTSEAIKCG